MDERNTTNSTKMGLPRNLIIPQYGDSVSVIYLKVFKCAYKHYITFHLQYTFIRKQIQFTNTKKKHCQIKQYLLKDISMANFYFKYSLKMKTFLLHWVSILMIWIFYIENQRLGISILLSVLKNKNTFFFSRDKCVRKKIY